MESEVGRGCGGCRWTFEINEDKVIMEGELVLFERMLVNKRKTIKRKSRCKFRRTAIRRRKTEDLTKDKDKKCRKKPTSVRMIVDDSYPHTRRTTQSYLIRCRSGDVAELRCGNGNRDVA